MFGTQPMANMSYNTRLSQLRQGRAWHIVRGDFRPQHIYAVLKYMPPVGARHAIFHFRHYFIAGRQLAGCVVFVRGCALGWPLLHSGRVRILVQVDAFFSDSYLAKVLRQAGWGPRWLVMQISVWQYTQAPGWLVAGGRKTWVGRFRGSMKSCVRSLLHAGCWVATGHDQTRL